MRRPGRFDRSGREKLQFNLWAFVYMPDHVHLIVHPRTYPYDTSQWIKEVKEPGRLHHKSGSEEDFLEVLIAGGG